MTSVKIGRNDPCPCGSGKKYKHCCFDSASGAKPEWEQDDPVLALRRAMQQESFETIDDAQRFVQQFQMKQNSAPLEDFLGLNPAQMHDVLYNPFESPDVLSFPDVLPEAPQAPVMTLMQLIVDAVGGKGLKATAKGNLPRAFTREAALTYWGPERHAIETRYSGINREADFMDLEKTRITMEEARLLRLQKGRFHLTGHFDRIMKRGGYAAVYPVLLRAFIEEVEWGYWDRCADLPIVQDSAAFSLRLLQREFGKTQPEKMYGEAFLAAFPSATLQATRILWGTPEETVSNAYALRFLDRFAVFFGLASSKPLDELPYPLHHEYTPLPLVNEVVRFRV